MGVGEGMTCIRRFTADDLFHFNGVNLDPLTETFNLAFYLQYLATWPDFFSVEHNNASNMMGYIMGKAEGRGTDWHGHVTAVTVAPSFRRIGLASSMMHWLERVSEQIYDGYFVDLFVRKSNNVAVGMYERLGYTVYRTVLK